MKQAAQWIGSIVLVIALGVMMLWMDNNAREHTQAKGACDTTCAVQGYTGSFVQHDGCWCERPDGPNRVLQVRIDVPRTEGK